MPLPPDSRQKILDILLLGGTLRDAADYVGISPADLARERHHDPNFNRLVRHTLSSNKLRLVNHVGSAPQWQAAAFLLERKWPAEFARPKRTDKKPPSRSIYARPTPVDNKDPDPIPEPESDAADQPADQIPPTPPQNPPK